MNSFINHVEYHPEISCRTHGALDNGSGFFRTTHTWGSNFRLQHVCIIFHWWFTRQTLLEQQLVAVSPVGKDCVGGECFLGIILWNWEASDLRLCWATSTRFEDSLRYEEDVLDTCMTLKNCWEEKCVWLKYDTLEDFLKANREVENIKKILMELWNSNVAFETTVKFGKTARCYAKLVVVS
jgi:hypothetical protein